MRLFQHPTPSRSGRACRLLFGSPSCWLQGAAFDLPEELVQKMLANEAELSSREFMLDLPKSLPLEEEHMQGRDSRGHRGGSRGGSYGGRRDGGYGGRDQRDGNRWSGRWADSHCCRAWLVFLRARVSRLWKQGVVAGQ